MQYTLPLKQKQIEQSKLEAEARKEATIENAYADAQAKVIDSKAELSAANCSPKPKRIGSASPLRPMPNAWPAKRRLLNQTPLLINKIIAERLSDKIQIMMVPSDGKYFFAMTCCVA